MRNLFLIYCLFFSINTIAQISRGVNTAKIDSVDSEKSTEEEMKRNSKETCENSSPSLEQFVTCIFPLGSIKPKKNGLYIQSGKTKYLGSKYTHLFFDQFGNLLYSAIPQGIANQLFVVHLFYKSDENIAYSIDGDGEFDGSLVILNSGKIDDLRIEKSQTEIWHHVEALMPRATNSLKIDIYRTLFKENKIEKNLISSKTVKMAKNYHAAVNLGLFNSSLQSPNYSLIASPNNSNSKVVKEDLPGKNGVVAALATFYYSPVAILKEILRPGENDLLTGRNFLEDQPIFERIYPSIGIKLGDKGFSNLFYGFNWEIVRGGGFYFGRHFGKVNTFDSSNIKDFKFGVSEIEESNYNSRTINKWKSNWVFGATLDLSIATEIFKSK